MERKVGKIVATAVCAVVVAITALLLIMNAAGVRNYVMESTSMSSEIKPGTLCFVNTNADYDSVEVGDVIAFDTTDINGDEMLMISRVTDVTETGLVTQGDANEFSDGIAATEEGFIGKTALAIPVLGRVADVMRMTVMRVIIYAALVAVVLVAVFAGRGRDDSLGLEGIGNSRDDDEEEDEYYDDEDDDMI